MLISRFGLPSASDGETYQTEEAAAQSKHAAWLGYVLNTNAEAVNVCYICSSAGGGVMSKIDAPAGKLRDIGDRDSVVNQCAIIPAVGFHLREVPDHCDVCPLAIDVRC